MVMTPRVETVSVLGSRMSYRVVGRGRPVVLLHGNPTSSWLWRHVLQRVASGQGSGRWIAVDLIGMGASDKPELDYVFADHVAHVDGLIDALGLDDIVLVGHDWGVAVALDHLRRHPDRVRAVAVMEGHLRPLPGWETFDEGGRVLFRQLRTPGVGERMVLQENFFLRTLLTAGLVRQLPEEELEPYRRPYLDEPSRRPLLQWARQIPVAGEPPAVAQAMQEALDHLRGSDVPALLLHGRPGVLVTEETVLWCRAHLTALDVVDVGGPAGHFLPEDRPNQVAEVLTRWVDDLP